MHVQPTEVTAAAPTAWASSRRHTDVACRALDIVVATIALVVLAPLLVLVGVAVAVDSPGPPLFRQRRVGRGLEVFTVNKFRTMRHGVGHDVHRAFVLALIAGGEAQRDGEPPRYKLVADARLTPLGGLLRRTSIDELPQLWNVLRGEMSLVGPRPPIPYEVEQYPAHWLARFAVRPGLTGAWQVNGRSTVPLEEMVRLDVDYVERRSLGLNLWILLRTIPAVVRARGAR